MSTLAQCADCAHMPASHLEHGCIECAAEGFRCPEHVLQWSLVEIADRISTTTMFTNAAARAAVTIVAEQTDSTLGQLANMLPLLAALTTAQGRTDLPYVAAMFVRTAGTLAEKART